MLQTLIYLMQELGIEIQINESIFVYGFVLFIVFICLLAVITQWHLVKQAIKQIVIQLFKEFKYDDETLNMFYDTIVEKVKRKLRIPDKNGKIPKVNKFICIFLSLPITRGLVTKQIKYYLNEILRKCQDDGIDVHKVLNDDDTFEVPKIK